MRWTDWSYVFYRLTSDTIPHSDGGVKWAVRHTCLKFREEVQIVDKNLGGKG